MNEFEKYEINIPLYGTLTTGWMPSGYSNKKDKVKQIVEYYRSKHNQRKNKIASKSRRRNRR